MSHPTYLFHPIYARLLLSSVGMFAHLRPPCLRAYCISRVHLEPYACTNDGTESLVRKAIRHAAMSFSGSSLRLTPTPSSTELRVAQGLRRAKLPRGFKE